MALIKTVKGKTPQWGKDCYFAETATLLGDVIMGDGCSIWFNAVLRGDVHFIRLGNNVNVQDGAIIHCTYQKYPVNIGNNVSIAHGAIVHGCTLHDNVLIGMGAIVMDDVVIESNSVIAAGAVVTKGTKVPSGTVFGGMPARKIKSVDKALLEGEVLRIAQNYRMYASWYTENTERKP